MLFVAVILKGDPLPMPVEVIARCSPGSEADVHEFAVAGGRWGTGSVILLEGIAELFRIHLPHQLSQLLLHVAPLLKQSRIERVLVEGGAFR